jgi:DNA relaxase NicK
MADSTGVVIESQVDWLTVSAHGENPADRLLDFAYSLAAVEQQSGNKLKPWRTMGYEGYHVGRVEYGQRDSASTILRLIGQLADEQLGTALSVSDQATRVDLATTYRAIPPDPYLGVNTYSLAEMFYAAHPNSALPSHIADARKGYTCYLGSRESANYFRVYNKEAECIAVGDCPGAERYKDCWRYELEVKAGNARVLAERLNDQEDRAAYVQAYLSQYCQVHGIDPPFAPESPRVLLPGFRRRSDAESRLTHLAKNVRPTLDWLRDQGQLERALDALGLNAAE